MGVMASQITSLMIVYSTFYSGADHRKHQSSASLAFVRGIRRWPVNSPHKWPVTRKTFPFDDVIMPSSPVVARPFSPNYSQQIPGEVMPVKYIYCLFFLYHFVVIALYARVGRTRPHRHRGSNGSFILSGLPEIMSCRWCVLSMIYGIGIVTLHEIPH